MLKVQVRKVEGGLYEWSIAGESFSLPGGAVYDSRGAAVTAATNVVSAIKREEVEVEYIQG